VLLLSTKQTLNNRVDILAD